MAGWEKSNQKKELFKSEAQSQRSNLFICSTRYRILVSVNSALCRPGHLTARNQQRSCFEVKERKEPTSELRDSFIWPKREAYQQLLTLKRERLLSWISDFKLTFGGSPSQERSQTSTVRSGKELKWRPMIEARFIQTCFFNFLFLLSYPFCFLIYLPFPVFLGRSFRVCTVRTSNLEVLA